MRNRLTQVLTAIVSLGVGASSVLAVPSDVSGTYDNSEGTVHFLIGQNELYVSYAAEFGAGHSCTCLARAHAVAPNKYEFDPGADFTGTAEIGSDGEASFDVKDNMCCGSGWSGLPDFSLKDRRPPRQCTVKSARAFFHAKDGKKRPAYVMKGDSVDVVPAPGEVGRQFWLGRFVGPKKTTIGLLKKEEVACAAQK